MRAGMRDHTSIASSPSSGLAHARGDEGAGQASEPLPGWLAHARGDEGPML